MSLIVTGTIGIDTVYTPHGHREKVLGGSCTYFAAAASFFGPVRVVAAAGEDLPAAFRETLARFKGVDTTGLEIRRGSKTFAWGGKYSQDMNSRETLFTELGVLMERPPTIPSAFASTPFVFLANSHPGVQLQFLEALPQRVLAVADTMDLWISTARPELDLLLTKVDGLVLNYDEAERLTGKANAVTAALETLRMMGGGRPGSKKFVVVKKGEHGCLLATAEGLAAMPAYPAETVIDPTGAGDSFAGGMMGSIAANHAAGLSGAELIRRALAHGTVMASFTIESFSLDRLAELSKSEYDRRYQQFVKMLALA
jgi:cytidine kinase